MTDASFFSFSVQNKTCYCFSNNVVYQTSLSAKCIVNDLNSRRNWQHVIFHFPLLRLFLVVVWGRPVEHIVLNLLFNKKSLLHIHTIHRLAQAFIFLVIQRKLKLLNRYICILIVENNLQSKWLPAVCHITGSFHGWATSF